MNWEPPNSCIIDGIQNSTGCTTGKRNITVFRKGDKLLEITMNPEVRGDPRNPHTGGGKDKNSYGRADQEASAYHLQNKIESKRISKWGNSSLLF